MYYSTLQTDWLPLVAEIFEKKQTYLFQLGNVSIHSANNTCIWLSTEIIRTLTVPTKALDYNMVDHEDESWLGGMSLAINSMKVLKR